MRRALSRQRGFRVKLVARAKLAFRQLPDRRQARPRSRTAVLRLQMPAPRAARLRRPVPNFMFLCHPLLLEMHENPSLLRVLYLTTTGRTTGLARRIEIWFVTHDGRLYLLAEHFHKTQWVQNVLRNPRVQVELGDRAFAATARVLDQTADRATWEIAQNLGREKYGWGEGLPVEITPDSPL